MVSLFQIHYIVQSAFAVAYNDTPNQFNYI